MKQKMKKILLAVLLCMTFGLIIPLMAFAADFSDPEEAEQIRAYSVDNVKAITELDDYSIEQYIAQFEAAKQTAIAKGLRSWQELKQEIGPVVSVDSSEIRELDDGYLTSMQITCESGRTATVNIGMSTKDGNITQLNFDKNQNLGEKMKSGAFNLVVGMGTVFCVLIFIAFLISQFKHIYAWNQAQEKVKQEEADYQAKVAAAKRLPAVSKNVSKRISADQVRAAKIPEGTVVRLIESDEPEAAAAPAEPAAMDGQLLAVLAAAVAASEAPDPQLIAVITAAIQEFEGNNAGPDGLVVRSIRRVSGRRR